MQGPYDRLPVASNHQATTHFRKLDETKYSNNTLVREHATGRNILDISQLLNYFGYKPKLFHLCCLPKCIF